MGRVILPVAGPVYVDAMIVIYSVERHHDYWPLLEPFWEDTAAQSLDVVTSELTLMETLVSPFRSGDTSLVGAYENALLGGAVGLMPIALPVLRQAARLRAQTGSLRTPDATHAATALSERCALFLTNGTRLRSVHGLAVTLLADLIDDPGAPAAA